MGFADLLIRLGIPYDSVKPCCSRRIDAFFHRESVRASATLAEERGVFPKSSEVDLRPAKSPPPQCHGQYDRPHRHDQHHRRLFQRDRAVVRGLLRPQRLVRNPAPGDQSAFRRTRQEERVLQQGADRPNLPFRFGKSILGIPAGVKKVFPTAFDVTPWQHLNVQAAFQKYSDNSVSKTINLPNEATEDDVRRIYNLAYGLKCKGITVYRYGSKESQVLSFASEERGNPNPGGEWIAVNSDFAGGCVSGVCPF